MPAVNHPLRRPELVRAFRLGEIALRQAMGGIRYYGRHALIVRPGEQQELVFRLRTGWVGRARTLADGRNQILNIAIPGDFVGLHTMPFDRSLDSVACLTRVTAMVIHQSQLWELAARDHNVSIFLLVGLSAELRRQDNWLVGLGQCTAEERLAAMLLDLGERLGGRGLLVRGAFRLPLTQQQIGDYIGMTAVHINRVLKRLSGSGAATMRRRVVRLHDRAALKHIAEPFDDLWPDALPPYE
jgi:CRP-like cAMP-binding protein